MRILRHTLGICSISDCIKKHYAKGFCRDHYQQYNKNIINLDGSVELKKIRCKSCGEIIVFKATSKKNYLKWCENCRRKKLKEYMTEYHHRPKVIKRLQEKHKQTYVPKLNKKKKYDSIIEARKQKKTYAEIGKIFGISRQRVHQICLKYREENNNGTKTTQTYDRIKNSSN